jgi:Short C-terminal domain
MAQQQPIRVVVEKKGGCLSGCGTALAVLFLIAIAIKFWYVSVGLIVLAVIVGVVANSQQKQKAKEAARRRPGPRDPWLNEVAVALGELGLTEVARNTGSQLGGAPMEGDIGLQEDKLLIYVNLFANQELARQAEVGLRAQPNIRNAAANGQTTLKTLGPVLLVANGRGGVVDEYRMNEVEHAVADVPLPPALKRPAVPPPVSSAVPSPGVSDAEALAGADPLEQIRKLAELRDAGFLTEAEFEAKKMELLRRV